MSEQDFTHATLRERIVEHVFLGDLLSALWNRGDRDIEVLRPEFDTHGYDVVLSCRSIERYVQLKTLSGKNRKFSIGDPLATKPNGCVVCISVKSETLELGPFFWFGGRPGKPFPKISDYPNARRATHNAEGYRPLRRNYREVPLGDFEKVLTMDDIIARLFGTGVDSRRDVDDQTLDNHGTLSS